MKSLFIFTIMVLAAVPSCNDDEEIFIDRIEDAGIIGKWKLESRQINGISNLAVQCCDYLEFEQDDEPDDLRGSFQAYGFLYEADGTFTLDLNVGSILFEYDDSQRKYSYGLDEDTLTFFYPEDGNEIIETWRREP